MEETKPVVIRGRTIDRERFRQHVPVRYPKRSARRFRQRMPSTYDMNIGNTVKIIRKVLISAVLLIAVLLFNIIDTPFTKSIIHSVKLMLTEDFLPGDALGKLKFVDNFIPDIASVFSHQKDNDNGENKVSFIAPVNGSVISLYGDVTAFGGNLKNEGIDILTGKNSEFCSAADGTVAAIENHEVFGRSVWISHDGGYFTFYGGCKDLFIKEGQRVVRGEKLGKTAEYETDRFLLHFEIWNKDKTCNPLDFIKAAGKM